MSFLFYYRSQLLTVWNIQWSTHATWTIQILGQQYIAEHLGQRSLFLPVWLEAVAHAVVVTDNNIAVTGLSFTLSLTQSV